MEYEEHLNSLPYTIYKVTCLVNGKIYIGLTNTNGADRWRRHLSEAFVGGIKNHFKNAVRKYGSDNFTVEDIDWCHGFAEACKLETKWIAHYNSYETGYNGTKGGQGVPGCFWKDNPERVAKASKATRDRQLAIPPVDRLASEDQKRRQSESHLKRVRNLVVVMGIEFNSIRAAARHFNTSLFFIKKYLVSGVLETHTVEKRKKPYRVGSMTFETRQAAADFLKVNVHNISWKIRHLTEQGILERVLKDLTPL